MPVEAFEFVGASGSRLFGKIEAPEATPRGSALLLRVWRPFHTGRSFIEDLARQDIEANAASLHRRPLVMHAPLDAVVGIDHASR